jgi:hypothetical protein
MAREVNLGNNIDITLGSITHNITALILSVIAAVWLTVVDASIRTDNCLLADATLLGKARELSHLEAPALIVGQVPVELVATVKLHSIDELLDHLDSEELT